MAEQQAQEQNTELADLAFGTSVEPEQDSTTAKPLEKSEPATTAEEPEKTGAKPATEPEKPSSEVKKDIPTHVPVSVLVQERRELQERHQRHLQELQETFKKELATFRAAQAAPKQPDPEIDPEGHRKYVQAQQDKDLAETKTRLQEIEQRELATQEQAQFIKYVGGQEREYATKEAPDYFDALGHLREARISELRLIGYTDADIPNILELEAWDVAVRAHNANVNPAQQFYALAKARGYQPKKGQGQSKPSAESTQNTEKLATLHAGKEAAKSLSKAGSEPSESEDLTFEKISSLHGAALEKAMNKYVKKLVGTPEF